MTERDLSLGLWLQEGELRLVEYRRAWKSVFETEAERISVHLPVGSELEHIGSTAVPGLSAKPVLDLAIRLIDPSAVATVEAALPALSYRFHFDGGASRGRIWRKEPGGLCTHILHLVLVDDPQWGRWLALRDLLRQSAQARKQYAEAKAQAMSRARDRQEYTRLKTATIQRLLSGT